MSSFVNTVSQARWRPFSFFVSRNINHVQWDPWKIMDKIVNWHDNTTVSHHQLDMRLTFKTDTWLAMFWPVISGRLFWGESRRYDPISTRLLDIGASIEFCSEFWSTESDILTCVSPTSETGGRLVMGDMRLALLNSLIIRLCWWCWWWGCWCWWWWWWWTDAEADTPSSVTSPRFSLPFITMPRSSSELVLGVASFPLFSCSALSLYNTHQRVRKATEKYKTVRMLPSKI